MRIGFVVYDDTAITSGGFVYDRRLIAGLEATGHDVTVVQLPWHSYYRSLLQNWTARVDARLPPDLDVLLQDELCHPSLVVQNRGHRSDLPVVAVVHHLGASEPDTGITRWVRTAIERRYLTSISAFVYNSHATKTSVENRIGPTWGIVAPPAGDRLTPTVTLDRIRERAHDDGPLRVLFVGNVVPRKGLDTLIEGVRNLDDVPWTLTVVGDTTIDPEYTARLRASISATGLSDSVTFVGRLQDDALGDAYASAHVLAVPSRYEGFGIVYMEGMAFGLPVVASTAGGASEVVGHGETGFLVPPDSPSHVTRSLGILARDRDRLARMGQAARARYRDHPPWTRTVDRVESFLTALVD